MRTPDKLLDARLLDFWDMTKSTSMTKVSVTDFITHFEGDVTLKNIINFFRPRNYFTGRPHLDDLMFVRASDFQPHSSSQETDQNTRLLLELTERSGSKFRTSSTVARY